MSQPPGPWSGLAKEAGAVLEAWVAAGANVAVERTAIQRLAAASPEIQAEVARRFVRTPDFAVVRNPSGYLVGILKRVLAGWSPSLPRPPAHSGAEEDPADSAQTRMEHRNGDNADTHHVDPAVQALWEQAFGMGQAAARSDEFRGLAGASVQEQTEVFTRFLRSREASRVENVGGYLVGILQRVRRDPPHRGSHFPAGHGAPWSDEAIKAEWLTILATFIRAAAQREDSSTLAVLARFWREAHGQGRETQAGSVADHSGRTAENGEENVEAHEEDAAGAEVDTVM